MTAMIDVRTAFKAAVVIASDLDEASICWGNAEGIMADPVIKLFQTVSVECTPWLETLSGIGATLIRALSQWREITFQVRVETVNGETIYDASDLAQETLLGLRRQDARDALEGVLIDTPSTIRPMTYRTDGRIVHAWAFDAIIRAELTRTDPVGVGRIEIAESTGDLLDPPSTHIPLETIIP